MLNLEESYVVNTKLKKPSSLSMRFFEHAHRVEHAELLRDGLEEIESSSSSTDEYPSKLKAFVAEQGTIHDVSR